MRAYLESATQTAATSGSSFATYQPFVTSIAGKLAQGIESSSRLSRALRAEASFRSAPAQLRSRHQSQSSIIIRLHMAGHSLDSSYDSLLADCKNGVGSTQLHHSANEDSTSMPSTTSFGAFEAKIFTETP